VLPGQETRTPDDFELYLEGILESPRGCRDVFVNHHYVPPYKNSPSASTYPCCPGCPQHGPIGGGSNGCCGCGNGDGVGAHGAVTSTAPVPTAGNGTATPLPAPPVPAEQLQRTGATAPGLPSPTTLPLGMDSGVHMIPPAPSVPAGTAVQP